MKDLINIWKGTYFTQPLLTLTLLIMFLLTFKNVRKYPALKFLPFYLILFFLLNTFDYVIAIDFNYNYRDNLFRLWGNFIVTITEFITFAYFIYTIVSSLIFKEIIKYLSLTTLTIFLITSMTGQGLGFYALDNIYIIESTVLIFCCVLTLIDSIQSKSNHHFRFSDFWVISGLAFYLLVSFPVTIISNHISTFSFLLLVKFYCIVHCSYIIMFLFILKGYSCRKKEMRANYIIP